MSGSTHPSPEQKAALVEWIGAISEAAEISAYSAKPSLAIRITKARNGLLASLDSESEAPPTE